MAQLVIDIYATFPEAEAVGRSLATAIGAPEDLPEVGRSTAEVTETLATQWAAEHPGEVTEESRDGYELSWKLGSDTAVRAAEAVARIYLLGLAKGHAVDEIPWMTTLLLGSETER